MKIFVAGATGTLGRPVVRTLLSHGHEVAGLTRSEASRGVLQQMGVRGIVGNALDASVVRAALMAVEPDQVVHLLTALPAGGALRASQLRATNEIRIVATANLVAAAIAARSRRLVAESFIGVYGTDTGPAAVSEDDPLPAVGRGPLREAVIALRSLEDQLRTARQSSLLETVALRIGLLYGPDVPASSLLINQAKAGRLFVPRDLFGTAPFVQIDDAASAIVAAIEAPHPSATYNVVDDEPMALGTFLAAMTRAVGAPPPRHLPAWLVRLAAPVIAEGGSARLLLSNAKAKRELGWALRYPTMRDGLATLSNLVAEAA